MLLKQSCFSIFVLFFFNNGWINTGDDGRKPKKSKPTCSTNSPPVFIIPLQYHSQCATRVPAPSLVGVWKLYYQRGAASSRAATNRNAQKESLANGRAALVLPPMTGEGVLGGLGLTSQQVETVVLPTFWGQQYLP